MARKSDGFFRMGRDFLLDDRRRRLSCAEREVHLYMSFYSWRGNDANGIHADGEVLVTTQQLMELTGYQKSVVYAAIAKLIEVGLAEKRGRAILLKGRTDAARDSTATESSSVTVEGDSATVETRESGIAAGWPPGPLKGQLQSPSEFRVQANGTESSNESPFDDEPYLPQAVDMVDERGWIPVTHTRSGQSVYVRA